jgi:hypothetical protein
MMEKYGFVYIWHDTKTKRFYIGAHWGTENDGYICSSTWMMRAYNKRPNDFKRRILERVDSSIEDTFLAEDRWLLKIKQEKLKKRYYNIQNKGQNYWFTLGEKKSLSVKQKISKTKTGVPVHSDAYKNRRRQMALGNPGGFGGIPGMLGKKHKEETKRKISDKNRGKTQPKEAIEKTRLANLGRKRSDHEKKKISESMKLVWTEERKQNHKKYLESLPKISCPHCGKIGKNRGAMARYHFNNCKYKVL